MSDGERQAKPATYGRSRAVRWDAWDYRSDAPVHLVLCVLNRDAFGEGAVCQTVCDSVERCSELLGFALYGYCLMPDHLHVLLSPASSGTPVSEWLRKFKSYTGHAYAKRDRGRQLWQRSAYDHVCKDGETAESVLAYIANNPVRRGLTETWSDWRWTRAFIEI